jgi:DNA-binding PadR family transcriptional regulator
MFNRHFFGPERHAHFFEKGDLKYVILDLLKDKPRHGYEIIRELEACFHGFYTPSAGSVYPTLQLLEDLGYVKALEQDGKKVYTITEEGKKFLIDREETIDKIKDHMKDHMHGWGCTSEREEFRDMLHEFRDIAHLFKQRARNLSPENLIKIKEVLRKANQEIETILKD